MPISSEMLWKTIYGICYLSTAQILSYVGRIRTGIQFPQKLQSGPSNNRFKRNSPNILGSNSGQDTQYPEEFHGFPQSSRGILGWLLEVDLVQLLLYSLYFILIYHATSL
jgi:hypothetical protein